MRLDELLLEYRIHNEPSLDSFILQLIKKVNNNHTNYDNIVNWLNKKVKKELANNDTYSHKLSSTDISQLSNDFDIKYASNGTLRNFKPTDELKDDLNHIIDWLNSEGMSNYNPMGIKDINSAYTMAEDFFQQKQIKMEKELEKRKKNPKYKYSDEMGEIKPIMEFNNGYTVVQLLTPQSLDYESCNMGHCVGHGSYDDAINSGSTVIYSLRDNKQQPHCTIEYNVKQQSIEQIKGKNNKPVIEKYRHYVKQFINSGLIVIKTVNDSKNIGLANVDGKLYSIEQLMTMKDLIVEGDVDLSEMELTVLPPCFKEIKGSFNCSNNNLTTLEGSPHTVGGSFSCDNNKLTTLEHCPHTVGEDFDCSNNNLTTLEGSPQTVGGSFYCYHNAIKLVRPKNVKIGGDFVN